jgi:hypothetical protein
MLAAEFRILFRIVEMFLKVFVTQNGKTFCDTDAQISIAKTFLVK